MRKALLSRWLISWLLATMLAHGLMLSVHRAGHAHYVAGTSSSLLGGAAASADSVTASLSVSQFDPKSSGVAQHEQGFCPVCAVLGFVEQSLPLSAKVAAQLSDRIRVASTSWVADHRMNMALPFSHGPPAL